VAYSFWGHPVHRITVREWSFSDVGISVLYQTTVLTYAFRMQCDDR